MRRIVAMFLGALALSGCVSLFEDAYDDQARSQCDERSSRDRGACYDEVDRRRRERDER